MRLIISVIKLMDMASAWEDVRLNTQHRWMERTDCRCAGHWNESRNI